MGKVSVLFVCMLFGLCGCFTVENHGNEGSKGRLRGRDIAEKGKPVKITGTLKQVGNEWAIVAGGKTCNTHFGKDDYRKEKGVELKEGKTVVIEGFQIGDDIVVCKLTMDGITTRFRDKDGRPLWAGHGRGEGEEGEGRGHGRGNGKK